MKTQREKKLEVALLKEKIERISGKKVLFKEGDNESKFEVIGLDEIDFSDDEELSKVFPFTPTNKELENLQKDKYPKVWEDSIGRGTIAIYELPDKVYMYAFEDAEYFLKTGKNSQLDF